MRFRRGKRGAPEGARECHIVPNQCQTVPFCVPLVTTKRVACRVGSWKPEVGSPRSASLIANRSSRLPHDSWLAAQSSWLPAPRSMPLCLYAPHLPNFTAPTHRIRPPQHVIRYYVMKTDGPRTTRPRNARRCARNLANPPDSPRSWLSPGSGLDYFWVVPGSMAQRGGWRQSTQQSKLTARSDISACNGGPVLALVPPFNCRFIPQCLLI
jgi:hypothetical protein